jgi:hypothetical protein
VQKVVPVQDSSSTLLLVRVSQKYIDKDRFESELYISVIEFICSAILMCRKENGATLEWLPKQVHLDILFLYNIYK